MSNAEMIEINPDDPVTPMTEESRMAVAALALRQGRASGVLMKGILFVGGQVEDGLKLLPKGVRAQVELAARSALRHSYDLASTSRGNGPLSVVMRRVSTDRAHKVLGAMSGALGGFGGLPTALAELPVATTVIFRAVQGVAESYGEDPLSEETRLECLRVFGAGGPGEGDDGINTSFIGARMSLSGVALNRMIARIAPQFAAVLSQKLASQAVPLLGAAAGAGTNYAFIGYYVEMAHVHFGLRRLIREHGERAVLDLFHKTLAEGKVPVRTA
jgi:hypothetical protein